MLFAGNFAPKGWAFCNGQAVNISSNEALFSILGTSFGGDGELSFNLPNIQFSLFSDCNNDLEIFDKSELHISISDVAKNHRSHKVQVTISKQINPISQKVQTTINNQQESANTFLNYCIAVQGLFPSNI